MRNEGHQAADKHEWNKAIDKCELETDVVYIQVPVPAVAIMPVLVCT